MGARRREKSSLNRQSAAILAQARFKKHAFPARNYLSGRVASGWQDVYRGQFRLRQRREPQPHCPAQCQWRSLDSSFNPGPGANGTVRLITLQPDGNVIIGGDFTTVNGVVRPHIARLYGDSPWPSLNIARSSSFANLSWPMTALNFQLQENTNRALPNAWSPVAQLAVTNGAQISVTVPTSAARKFFRLKSQ